MIEIWRQDGLRLMEGPATLLNELGAIGSEADVQSFLRGLAADFDFKGFLLVDVPSASDVKLTPRIVMSDLPAGFLRDYDSLGLLKNSPIFAGLRRSTAPFSWCIKTMNSKRPKAETEAARQFFTRHSMTSSVYFPVHGACGRRAVVGFIGNRAALSHTEMGELGLYVMHVYDVYSRLKANTNGASASLTARELEVLHWAAGGKTSAEIAAIISLSDHTVNSYLNSAMRKLDCVNRTHLVAKALRLHLIS